MPRKRRVIKDASGATARLEGFDVGDAGLEQIDREARVMGRALARRVGESQRGPAITVDTSDRRRHVGLTIPKEGTSNKEVATRRRKRRKRLSRGTRRGNR